MVNLHAKVFLGFWLSMLGIVGAWLLTDQYISQSNPQEENWDYQYAAPEFNPRHEQGDGRRPPRGGDRPPPPRAIFRIHYALQNLSLEELPGWIANAEQRMHMRIFIFNRKGEEIFNAEPLPGTRRILRQLTGRQHFAQDREGKNLLFAQQIYRPDEGRLAVVVVNLPPKSPFIHALTQYLWLRLLLAVIFTGLISFLVSRYLTQPLKALQFAARRLAEGNLNTRIEVPATGGDETAKLGRDFNTMADQLQQQIEAQKRLLKDVSHELRSPLARLRVALALAERDPDNAAQQLSRIEYETERLDELIAQLLQVPDYDLELEDSVDLVGLLGELCTDAHYEAQADGKQVQFECVLHEAVLRIKGDLLKKALENVIRNAVHYTASNSCVHVHLYSDGSHFRVRVCDQGEGAPESALERIFEPFYRVDEARTRETGGYGLGLSIAKQAVLKHQGTIRAYNSTEAGTKGLCIEISLPVDSGQ